MARAHYEKGTTNMKQKSQRFIPGLAALAGLALAGVAQADEGFSIGASATRAAVDVTTDTLDIDGDAGGFRLFGLYMFNEHVGIEAGFSALGEPAGTPDRTEVETSSYDMYAVGKYYIGLNGKLSVIGKAGFVTSNTETEIGDDDATETNHSSTDLALGLGAQYDFSERFGLRSTIDWVDAVDDGASRVLSLSGVWRFK